MVPFGATYSPGPGSGMGGFFRDCTTTGAMLTAPVDHLTSQWYALGGGPMSSGSLNRPFA
jgi:hypothetical protein